MPSGHVGQRELALLGGEGGVEHDLEQQVAQLLLEVLGPVARRVDVERVEGLEHLVGLLQQVARAATRGSARGPTGTRSRSVATSSTKRCTLGGDRGGERGMHSDVRWSGSTTRSRSAHAHLEHAPRRAGRAAGAPRPARRRRDRPTEGQLDVGEHVDGVALGDQQRAALAGGLDREALAVDQPHPGRDRIDAEAGPGQVEERQRRHDLDRRPRSSAAAAARPCARPRPASRARRRRPAASGGRPSTSRSTMAG